MRGFLGPMRCGLLACALAAPVAAGQAGQTPAWLGVRTTILGTTAPMDGEAMVSIMVTDVHPSGPAFRSGIRPGDRIRSVGGAGGSVVEAWNRLIFALAPGTVVELALERAGRVRTARFLAEARPDFAPAGAVAEAHSRISRSLDSLRLSLAVAQGFGGGGGAGEDQAADAREAAFEIYSPALPPILDAFTDSPFVLGGMRARTLTPELGEHFGLPKGILVIEVLPLSPADRLGFLSGDVVVRIEGREVASLRDLWAVVSESEEGAGSFRITLVRHGDTTSVLFGR